MSRLERQDRTERADARCVSALEQALGGCDGTGTALVAVGGYGRRELAPHSDLDVVLLHADEIDVRRVAESVWYPLWDAGVDLDHSVRALAEVTGAARHDPRVALGLLDARHVAGDPSVTLRLRADLLSHWRRDARRQLPKVRELVTRRSERYGELAHASVPDLKESVGGLRDATVLKALVATWLVDVSHTDLETARVQLLDVRDVLQGIVGRASDRVPPDAWGDLAAGLVLPDPESAQRHVREIGRRITHLSRLTWHRVDAVLERPPATRRRAPSLELIAPGVALSGGEVVLDRGARPADDPTLLLRAAAEAAERGVVLAPATAARLTREGADLPDRWPGEARNLLTRLLAAGPGLLTVWETLDETGALDRLLPEWSAVRLLPHASAVHRFTVDRHLVETCIEASRLIRHVSRPDVLLVAGLLHDLGKAQRGDHSVVGESLAEAAARRLGFEDREVRLVGALVRWHLLLAEVATTRDLEDPSTIERVAGRVRDPETLELLATLTEADARATSPKAWTSWRAGLVEELVRRVRDHLGGDGSVQRQDEHPLLDVADELRDDPRAVDVRVRPTESGATVTVVSGDRLGLMADIAGALAVHRVSIRSARAWSQQDLAVSVWEVDDAHLDGAVLRQRLDAVAERRLDPAARLRPPPESGLEPSVQVRHDASREATVIEVRVHDRPGVVHLVCAALAREQLSVRSAHLATFGPQAADVFYVQEPGAGRLPDERAASAVHAIRAALRPPVRVDA